MKYGQLCNDILQIISTEPVHRRRARKARHLQLHHTLYTSRKGARI